MAYASGIYKKLFQVPPEDACIVCGDQGVDTPPSTGESLLPTGQVGSRTQHLGRRCNSQLNSKFKFSQRPLEEEAEYGVHWGLGLREECGGREGGKNRKQMIAKVGGAVYEEFTFVYFIYIVYKWFYLCLDM